MTHLLHTGQQPPYTVPTAAAVTWLLTRISALCSPAPMPDAPAWCTRTPAAKPHRTSRQRIRRSSSQQVTGLRPGHLDYGTLTQIFTKVTGVTRLQFASVCKLWRQVALERTVHYAGSSRELGRVLKVRLQLVFLFYLGNMWS